MFVDLSIHQCLSQDIGLAIQMPSNAITAVADLTNDEEGLVDLLPKGEVVPVVGSHLNEAVPDYVVAHLPGKINLLAVLCEFGSINEGIKPSTHRVEEGDPDVALVDADFSLVLVVVEEPSPSGEIQGVLHPC